MMLIMKDASPPVIANLMPLDMFTEGLIGMLCEENSVDDVILNIMGDLVSGGHFDPLGNKRFFDYAKSQLSYHCGVKTLLWLIGVAFA